MRNIYFYLLDFHLSRDRIPISHAFSSLSVLFFNSCHGLLDNKAISRSMRWGASFSIHNLEAPSFFFSLFPGQETNRNISSIFAAVGWVAKPTQNVVVVEYVFLIFLA